MEPPTTFDFDAFISYRRGDGTAVARWLRARLQEYRLPPTLATDRQPIRAYLDTAFERATEDFWAQNIEPALRRSRFLVVVVTPSVFEPRADGEPSWVEREIRLFLTLPHARNILVVTAAGNPLDRLPSSLFGEFPRIDVVDLNEFGRSWNISKRSSLHDRTLTLVARIYDVADTDMPILRQEEERRRRKRAMQIATGAVALVAILSALLAFALVQWTHAAHERTAAEAKSLGFAALRDFESGRHIQGLLKAVEGGRKLQTLARANAAFDEYPTVTPLFALNSVLQGIRERDRWEHREDSMQLQGRTSTTDISVCALPKGVTDAGLPSFMRHKGQILARGCTPGGRYLVTTATDGTVRMADLSGSLRPELIGLQGAARYLSFDPDTTHFTTTDVWGTVVTWDLSGATTALQTILTGHKSTVRAISFSENGMLATGSSDGEIRTWSTTGRQIHDTIVTGEGPVLALWLSADAERLLAVNERGDMTVWQQNGPTPLLHVACMSAASVIDAAVGTDGKVVGLAIAGGDAKFCDLPTGKSASVRGTHDGWIMGVAFPPRGNIVATAGADDTIGLHRPSGEPYGKPIRADQGQVMSVAFSPDGNVLASAGEDGTVKLWSVSGTLIGLLIGHEGKVLTVRFSPDGRLLASAGADGTIRLWLRNGEQLSQWPGQEGFMTEEVSGGSFGTVGMSFSNDSRRIAIADSHGLVRIYRVQTIDELLESACAWLGPYVSSHPDAPRVCSFRTEAAPPSGG